MPWAASSRRQRQQRQVPARQPHANGNPWYFLRPNGDFVAWNGSNTSGTPLFTFNPAAFLNAELVHQAYHPAHYTGKFDLTNTAAIDFSPVSGLLRVVTDNEQNLRVDVATGKTTVDGVLHYTLPVDPSIVAAAYANNFVGATSTVLYDIDSSSDMLVTQNTATGLLTNVGPLGIDAPPPRASISPPPEMPSPCSLPQAPPTFS